MSYTRGSPRRTPFAISTVSPLTGPGVTGSTYASATWPTQYLGIYVPVIVPTTCVVVALAVSNGAAVSGTVDVGIYDSVGTRLVSSGPTSQSGTTTEQVIDVTNTTIQAGAYYLALVMDNTTGTVFRASITAPVCAAFGILTEAIGSGTLPATATWTVNQTLTYFPIMAALTTTVVT